MPRRILLIVCLLLALCCACAESKQNDTFKYENGLTAVKDGKYWKLLDRNGKVQLEKLKSTLPNFKGNYAAAKIGTGAFEDGLSSENVEVSLWGVIDSKGKTCIPFKYQHIVLINDKGTAAVQDASGRWGMMNARGKVLLDFEYESISGFTDDRAVVCTFGTPDTQGESLYGMIDESGRFILPAEYKYLEICGDGLVIAAHAETIGEFEMDTRYGYMDMDGKWVIQPVYAGANAFDGDYAVVSRNVPNDDLHSDTPQVLRQGLISRTGEIILPFEYESFSSVADDLTITAEKGGKKILFRLTENGAEEIKEVGSNLILEDYMPFTGSKVAKLSGEPTLEKRASAKHGHPRLDGATALFPVYAAIAEAVYPDETRYSDPDYDKLAKDDTLITCTKTNKAYDRLINGSADIIFCAGPSDAQVAAAKAEGVEFELTPFGKEAFVFIVNKDNPLENITVEQIQKVYSGEITRWEELGVDSLEEIIAYQRPENSGSQTALEKLMGDIPIMEAPSERIPTFMEDILETIEYRNLPNAIGYTFRFFCTEMIGSDVKLLSIDGVAPTVENIRNDAYPITSMLYMVTRKGEDNPNVQSLIDWVLSPQGQELVEKSGYVFYSE